MDLLFSRYASPFDLMKLYINNGRFGEFVSNVIRLEKERKEEKEDRDGEWMLWTMYTRLYPYYTEQTYVDWKAGLKIDTTRDGSSGASSTKSDADLTEDDIRNIIDGLFPE